jgi:argininosuccinate lyase
MPFRNAHAIAAALLKTQTDDPSVPLSRALSNASTAVLGHALDYSEADLQRIMSPANFVNVRTTYGGPAPKETSRAIAESQQKLAADRASWKTRRQQVADAEAKLVTRVKAL